MNIANVTYGKTNQMSREIIYKIGKKLPKKVRKKLRWKKLAPVLEILMTMFVYLTKNLSSRSQPNHQPTGKRRNAAQPSKKQESAASDTVQDSTLRGYITQAEAYQAEIDRLVQNATGTTIRPRGQEMAAHVQTWVTAVTALVYRIENFRQNKLIRKDLVEVPKSIKKLEARLSDESNEMVTAELERTLANRRQQLVVMETLQRNIAMAEVKIENTLSMLGIIYSQFLAGQSTRQVADYRRLMTGIDDEVQMLQDHLEALEEVKLAHR